MIRTDAIWMSIVPVDMRAGADTLLASILQVFGEVRPYHAYLFANQRTTRMKGLITSAASGQSCVIVCRDGTHLT
ncbi:MAG: IS66 family insertion sequence element accessory protein TnpB [Georgfuchsia sp.]